MKPKYKLGDLITPRWSKKSYPVSAVLEDRGDIIYVFITNLPEETLQWTWEHIKRYHRGNILEIDTNMLDSDLTYYYIEQQFTDGTHCCSVQSINFLQNLIDQLRKEITEQPHQ